MVCLLVLAGLVFQAGSLMAQPTLNAYGSATALLSPLKECAGAFYKKTGVQVRVTGGLQRDWIARARLNGDIVYSGSEFMMSNFIIRRPGFIAEGTRISLYPRPVGILVRKGNPKNIHSLEDLARPGVRLIEAVEISQVGLWEDAAGLVNLIPQIRKNTILRADRGGSHAAVSNEPGHRCLDHLRIAVLSDAGYCRDCRPAGGAPALTGDPFCGDGLFANRQYALKFLEFLSSDEAHGIFQSWGWK